MRSRRTRGRAAAFPRRTASAPIVHGRTFAFGALAVVGLAMVGCGGPGEATVEMRSAGTSTTFVTLAPEPTQPPADENGDADGDDGAGDAVADDDGPGYVVDPLTGDRMYTVEPGDALVRIARSFNVTPEAIVAANGWETVRQPINPGDQIRVPPPHADDGPEDSDVVDGTGDGDDFVLPDGVCDLYTIVSGDTPGRVAARHGIEVDELHAANAATPNYGSFVVGIDINVPCAAEATDDGDADDEDEDDTDD